MKTNLGGLYIGTCTFPFIHLVGLKKRKCSRKHLCWVKRSLTIGVLLICTNQLMGMISSNGASKV